MKTKFKQWLINQHSQCINDFGIDLILSHISNDLEILPTANELEAELLTEWINAFLDK
ncbi:hypothetical protein [Rodentibacter genomosp. 2]|uniref:hypothetical protein n=1 Tax=Rodentibacter genomosp. 2 TaxID=1908266 RepID=UPI001428940F